MLIGEFESKLGDKNRLAIPKKFRIEFENENLVITRGYERCLILADHSRWKSLVKSIEVRPLLNTNVRDLKRYIVGSAHEIDSDSQGRFVLSSLHKEFAAIRKEVVFVGIENWVEVWAKDKWTEKMNYLNENIADLADRLSETK